MKYAINKAIQAAARLAMIKKGRSLNDRDANTRLTFQDDRLEIVCGGLFAIARLELELDRKVPSIRFECDNEMLDAVSHTWTCDSMRVEAQKNGIKIVTDSGHLILPSKTLWDTFVYSDDTDVDFCSIDKETILAVFASTPNLLQDDSEKRYLSAMRMKSDGSKLIAESTDNRMIVNLSVPCSGKLPEIALPFAVLSLLRWAITEFGSIDCFKIGLSGNMIIAKLGPFTAHIKQSATKFPNFAPILNGVRNRKHSKVKFSTEEIVRAAKQAKALKYGHCDIAIAAKSRVSSGEDDSTVSVEVACERSDKNDKTVSLNPEYLLSTSNCIHRLGFEQMEYQYVDEVMPVLFAASNDQFVAEVVIAPMED